MLAHAVGIYAMCAPYHSYIPRGIFAASNALRSPTFDALIFVSEKCC